MMLISSFSTLQYLSNMDIYYAFLHFYSQQIVIYHTRLYIVEQTGVAVMSRGAWLGSPDKKKTGTTVLAS